MGRYIVMLLTLMPITLYAADIDLSGINRENVKKRLESVDAGGSILDEVIEKAAISAVNALSDSAENVRQHDTTAPTRSTNDSSSNGGSQRAYVTSMERDGKHTIVKCSVGKDTKVYHDDYGKCSDNYQIGSYGCSSVIKWAKERCANRS